MATIALDIGGTKIASAIFFPDGSMMFNRFVTEKGVATAPEVKATHIRTIVPGFSPSYTILNGARRYSLLGEKTSLLKVTILGTPVEEGGGSDSESPDEI